jgi:hypothetical protein
LQNLQQIAKEVDTYRNIPEDAMKEMLDLLELKRSLEKKSQRYGPHAQQQDVRATTQVIGKEASRT